MSKKPFDHDYKNTIFSNPQSLSSEERAAVKSGERRGELQFVKDNPEKFGQKVHKGMAYNEGYAKIDFSKKAKGAPELECHKVGNKKVFKIKKKAS